MSRMEGARPVALPIEEVCHSAGWTNEGLDRLYEWVRGVAYRVAQGPLPVDVAEDVAQELARELRAMAVAQPFNWGGHWPDERYVKRSTRYKVVRALRRHGLRLETGREYEARRVEADLAQGGGDVSLQKEFRELLHVATRALRTMSPERRRVFLLVRKHDLSYQAAAERLGVSVETVRSHVKNGLRDARAALAKYRRASK